MKAAIVKADGPDNQDGQPGELAPPFVRSRDYRYETFAGIRTGQQPVRLNQQEELASSINAIDAIEKEKTMRPVILSLRTLLAWISLVSLMIIVTVVNSAAQTAPNLVRMLQQRSQQASSPPDQAPQVLSSVPKWSILFPTVNDPDLFPQLYAHSAVYDPGSNTMIVFGGFDQNNVAQGTVLLESDANGSGGIQAGTWSELNLSFFPPPRTYHTAVYDQTNNRMIVFGGCAGFSFVVGCQVFLNDTWVLTNANGSGGTPAWTQLNPTGSLPSQRYQQNAVYDATNNRMIVYSGYGSVGGVSDVWVLTNANGLGGTPAWTQLSPNGGPPDAIDSSTAVYDPTSNTMIVFGGGNFVNSVWTLSNANGMGGTPTWTNLIANGTAGSPPGRIYPQAVYDSTNNRMTIYGGFGNFGTSNPDFDFGAYGDVWVLANANGSGGSPVWSQLHPKWVGDGKIQPGTRAYFSAVRDPGTDSLIIFGGINIEAGYVSPWVLSHANGL